MASTPFICAGCARALRLGALSTLSRAPLAPIRRHLSRSLPVSLLPADAADASHPNNPQRAVPSRSSQPPDPAPDPELGPMATRLQQATEDALLTGGRAGRRAIEEAGFSEELKAKLLDKVAGANFQHEHSAALAHVGITSRIPDSAGLGTRAMAWAQPWTGQETTEDTVLRMLDDARKPLAHELRRKEKPLVPEPVDMRIRREARGTPGQRASTARDKADAYAGMGVNGRGLNDKEREAVKREFRERFAPGARAMPTSVTGLASLANERIEDAIARGQFKNIPRGPGVERDTRADNPFIDTTEYILNKMIKRQDIVPPWIEKQQELVKAAANFRGRIRNDWKRHAARTIASRGGTLEQQLARAAAYARAEEAHNPRRRNPEQISIPTNATDDVVMVQAIATPTPTPTASSSSPTGEQQQQQQQQQQQPKKETADPIIAAHHHHHPFRDPAWEAAETPYMTLAIANLNALARSYNLMAPGLAKKPYFTLERELRNCFADVAPQVAAEIRLRATGPAKSLVDNHPFGGGSGLFKGGMGGLFGGGGGGGVSVVERREKRYGMRELWRDLWGNKLLK